MIKFLRQLFCSHEHKIVNSGFAKDGSGKVRNYICNKCGFESHIKLN